MLGYLSNEEISAGMKEFDGDTEYPENAHYHEE